MISEQDLLHSTETATQAQLLVNSDGLVTKMRQLAEGDEDNVVDVMPMVVKFQTETRDPTIGRIDEFLGMSIQVLTISFS